MAIYTFRTRIREGEMTAKTTLNNRQYIPGQDKTADILYDKLILEQLRATRRFTRTNRNQTVETKVEFVIV